MDSPEQLGRNAKHLGLLVFSGAELKCTAIAGLKIMSMGPLKPSFFCKAGLSEGTPTSSLRSLPLLIVFQVEVVIFCLWV